MLLVSLGPREKFGDKAFLDALAGAAKVLGAGKAKEAVVTLADVDVPPGRTLTWRMQQAARVLADEGYRFPAPKKKTNGAAEQDRGARSITLLTSWLPWSTRSRICPEATRRVLGMLSLPCPAKPSRS